MELGVSQRDQSPVPRLWFVSVSASGGPECVWDPFEDDAEWAVVEGRQGNSGVLRPAIPQPRITATLHADVIPLRPGSGGMSPATRPSAAVAALDQAGVARRRLLPWIPEWPAILVGVGVVVALGLAMYGSMRIGCIVLGAAVGLGAMLRTLLGDTGAGLLRSRSRVTDLIVMGVLSVALLALAWGIPAQV